MIIVPPVYYAHLASARARAHEIPSLKPKDTTTPSGTGNRSGDPARAAPIFATEDIKPLGAGITDAMWYI
jgi:hypothetical protein